MTVVGSATIELLGDSSQFEKEMEKASRKFQQVGSSLTSIGSALSLGVTAPLAAIAGIGIKSAQQLESFGAALRVLIGDADKANAVFDDLYEFSAGSPFDWRSLSDGTRMLAAFGVEAEEIVPTLKRIGDVSSGTGNNIAELAELYGKAKVQGRLMAEDINQLTGRGIPIIQEFAKQFGVAESEVKGLVSSGVVGFANLEAAFVSLTSEGGKFFGMTEQMADTSAGRFARLKDSFEQVSDIVGARLLPVFDGIVVRLQKASDWFVNLDEGAQTTIVLLGGLAAAVGPVMVALGGIITAGNTVAGVFGTNLPAVLSRLLPFLGPAGLIAGGLVALGVIWFKWGDTISLAVRAVWDVVRDRMSGVVDFIRSAFSLTVDAAVWWYNNVTKPVIRFVGVLGEWLIDKGGWIIEKFAGALLKVADVIAPGLANGIRAVQSFVSDIGARFEELRNESLLPTEQALDSVSESIATIPPVDFSGMLGSADAAKRAEEIEKTVKGLSSALREAGQMSALMGDQFDLTSAQAAAYESAVKALVSAGVNLDAVIGPQGETLRELADRYLDLSADVKATADSEKQYEDRVRSALQAVAALVPAEEKHLLTLENLNFALSEGIITQDAYERATKQVRDQLDGTSEAMKEFQGYIKSAMTEEEQLAAVQARLNGLVERGEITQQEFAKAIAEARDQIFDTKKETNELGKEITRIARSGTDAFVDFAFGAKNAISGFVDSALRSLAKLAASKVFGLLFSGVTGGTGGLLAGLFGGFFADGGFLQPGKFGIVGERGPEVIYGGRSGMTIEPVQPAMAGASAGSSVDSGELAAAIMARIGPPPAYASPEVAATDAYYRRLFSAMAEDGRRRGVRL